MEAVFYANGLRWSCTRCSHCCRHDSGFVFLSKHDVDALAAALEMNGDAFAQVYCRWVTLNGEVELLSLKEKSNNDCFFWKEGCSVYEARPAQCRTYPFWEGFLTSEQAWKEAVADCPGAGRGRLYSPEEIAACIELERAEQPLTRRIKGISAMH